MLSSATRSTAHHRQFPLAGYHADHPQSCSAWRLLMCSNVYLIGEKSGWGTWIQSPIPSGLCIFNDLAESASALWGPPVGYVDICTGGALMQVQQPHSI